jgi:AbrB family looped-hinge helix DNA binding protein
MSTEERMETLTLSPKFQIVIPKAIREKLRLKPGQKIQAMVFDNRIELIPVRSPAELRGCLKAMKTIKLEIESAAIADLLQMARNESLLLVLPDGSRYVLEEADDFDREVAQLGNSEAFMKFLEERAAEKGVVSLEDYAKELGEDD